MTLTCPQCSGETLHHSRTRSWVERIRRRMTERVPFRCHGCGWRGWLTELTPDGQGPREIHRDLTEAELERLEPDHTEEKGTT